MAATLPLIAALAGCGAPPVPQAAGGQALRVTNGDLPFGFDEGAAAKRQADAVCGARGVRVSIYDRFEGGAWVFPEGCA